MYGFFNSDKFTGWIHEVARIHEVTHVFSVMNYFSDIMIFINHYCAILFFPLRKAYTNNLILSYHFY